MNLSNVSRCRAPLTTMGLLMPDAACLGVRSCIVGHPRLWGCGCPVALGSDQCRVDVSLMRPLHHNITFSFISHRLLFTSPGFLVKIWLVNWLVGKWLLAVNTQFFGVFIRKPWQCPTQEVVCVLELQKQNVKAQERKRQSKVNFSLTQHKKSHRRTGNLWRETSYCVFLLKTFVVEEAYETPTYTGGCLIFWQGNTFMILITL